MSTQSGFSNEKMRGRSRHLTVQSLGSDRTGMPSAQLSLFEKLTGLNILSVLKSKDEKKLRIQFDAPHTANTWDVMRITTGNLLAWEFEVLAIPAADTIDVHNIGDIAGVEELPAIGNVCSIMRWVTNQADVNGNIQVTNGPMRIMLDGVSTQVNKDTVTPANTVPVPVEIVSASGTEINITAGDIDIHTTHAGAQYDSMRIGDGTNLMGVNASLEALVHDQDLLDELQTLNLVDFATEAKQDDAIDELVDLNAVLGSPTDAKELDPDAASATVIALLRGILDTQGGGGGGDATAANQTALNTLVGAVTEAAPGTDTASSGLNGRLQRLAQNITSLSSKFGAIGQQLMAASAPVVIASNQSAIPTTPGIAYNSGASNATTTRTMTASDSPELLLLGAQNSARESNPDAATANLNALIRGVMKAVQDLAITVAGSGSAISTGLTTPARALNPTTGSGTSALAVDATRKRVTITNYGPNRLAVGDDATISEVVDSERGYIIEVGAERTFNTTAVIYLAGQSYYTINSEN